MTSKEHKECMDQCAQLLEAYGCKHWVILTAEENPKRKGEFRVANKGHADSLSLRIMVDELLANCEEHLFDDDDE